MSEKKLHRYALLDKAGKNRGTVTATKMADARQIFSSNRLHFGMNPKLPTGWTIVDRGEVEAPESITVITRGPKPALKVKAPKIPLADPAIEVGGQGPSRAFKVGDEVEWIYTGPTSFSKISKNLEIGDKGSVVRLDINGSPVVDWDGSDAIKTHYFSDGKAHKYLRLLTPAPEPKAEEEKPGPHLLAGMVDRFLGWKLPEDFSPDCGISFNGKTRPTGTNLLDAIQAKAMLEHVAGPVLAAMRDGNHEPGSIEDCECLACSELAHREGYEMMCRERDAALAEIATLKAEVERLTGELADAGERLANLTESRDGWVQEVGYEARCRKAAEAKLEDIKAIMRVDELGRFHGAKNSGELISKVLAA